MGPVPTVLVESIPAREIRGEGYVTDGPAFAAGMVAEIELILASQGWRTLSGSRGLRVEACPVKGAFAASGVLLTRSTGRVGMDAQALFDHLVSPQGYAVIDPMSDPADHTLPPLEAWDWKPGCRLEAARARASMPFMHEREFVVLNAVDPPSRLFVSKSILHASCPGGSRYSAEQPPPGGRVRALNTFAIRVDPLGQGQSEVRCVNYADLAGIIPPAPLNFINTRFFLQALHRRMEKLAREKAGANLTPAAST